MRRILIAVTAIAFAISSCSEDEQIQPPAGKPEVTITVPDGGFTVDNLKWFRVNPVVKSDSATTTYLWTTGTDTLSTDKNLLYVFAEAGTYDITFTAKNSAGTTQQKVTVKVVAKTYTANAIKVYDFLPAPGQFVNEMPIWETGGTAATMLAKAQDELSKDGVITLGGFGGYVVMGLDHTIINKPGEYSFSVAGNAFENWSEPGIVMVSADKNGNGLPDDEWYEIAGSEYNDPETIHNYRITYYKPDENKVPTPNEETFMTDTTYIRWRDNQGNGGYLSKNGFHAQPYYPQWKGDSISFTGTRLGNSKLEDLSGNGTYIVIHAAEYGYSDNLPNTDEKGAIKISWAVDKDGKSVHLPGIDFVRVHTGMRAEGGWLGEVSTEVGILKDLNIKE